MVVVGFFPEFGAGPADLSLLVPHIQLPPHHTLSFQRKFITLECLIEGARGDTCVAIGPLHVEDSCGHGYGHDQIENCLAPEDFKVNGGGFVDFRGVANHEGEVHWTAKFTGESIKFGVFSPKMELDLNICVLSETLKMEVEISCVRTSWGARYRERRLQGSS